MRLRPALFVCDIQDRFRTVIHAFPEVIATSAKMLEAARILDMPVFVTTQNRARLGDTVSELDVSTAKVNADKTEFSMMIPDVASKLAPNQPVAIVGIEAHVCVLQTTLDLLRKNHSVYVISDGVSSSSKLEQAVALRRLTAEGAKVTTSESFLFEVMGDAVIPEFRAVSSLIKRTKDTSSAALEKLTKL